MAKAYVFRHSEIYISYETVEDHDAALQAFEAALHDKDNEGRLLCLGSLYLVGEIKRRRNIYFGK